MNELDDTSPMPFGKYKGTLLQDVPASYLLWLWNSGVWAQGERSIHRYIKESMSALEMDAPDVIVEHRP